MFSRCPHCDAQQAVTTQQLRDHRGLLDCLACGQTFDALPGLTEQADELVSAHRTPFDFFSQDKPVSVWHWRIVNCLLALVLLVQLAYFEADRLIQQPKLHKAFSRICQVVGCRLPIYQNPDDWSVSHSDLQAHLDNRYWLTAALTNHSDQMQSLPDLKLTINDYQGQPMMARIFAPSVFSMAATLPANQTLEIRLPLVVSAAHIGGFSLEVM